MKRNQQSLVNDYSKNFNTKNTQLPLDKSFEYRSNELISPIDNQID
jgi:hypothetical protein